MYAWSSRYWIDLIDEGYFVYLASRVHDGALPYRDFDTYYTPGIFYLYVWTLDLFGMSVGPIRVLMSAVRALLALLLYRLTRRVAPWPFALLPFLLVAGVDSAPVFPEPHPAWLATLATLGMMEAVARHQLSRARGWMILAGALAGLAFAFKQNAGAFAALAIGAHLVLRERRHTGRLLAIGQGVFVTGLALAVTVLLWPGLDVRLAAAYWLPLVAALGVLLWSDWTPGRIGGRIAGWTDGLAPLVADGLAAGLAFVAVTLGWLIPLTLALGVRNVPWALFAGSVNQGALTLQLELLPPSTHLVLVVAIWLPMALAILADRRSLARRRMLIGALVASVAVLFLPTGVQIDEGLVEEPVNYPWLGYLEAELGDLFLYLPSLCAWAGLAMLATVVVRRARAEPLAWYLIVGLLCGLTIYPRTDVTHAMFAGPALFVVGAWALAWVHRALARDLARPIQILVFLSLLVVPVAAITPHVYWRYVTMADADPRAPAPPPYVDLGLERARVLVPENVALGVRGAVEYVRAGTPPGRPFFAYPVDPLFYFLADRPNPTRFNHFIAGALTPDDLREVVRDLDRAKPRYVLWDHGGVVYFRTGPTNGILSDYVWGCYEQVANFTPYLILERRCP